MTRSALAILLPVALAASACTDPKPRIIGKFGGENFYLEANTHGSMIGFTCTSASLSPLYLDGSGDAHASGVMYPHGDRIPVTVDAHVVDPDVLDVTVLVQIPDAEPEHYQVVRDRPPNFTLFCALGAAPVSSAP